MYSEDEVVAESETLTSLNRALDVLEAFSAQEPDWGLSELSRQLGIGKPTLHRVLRTLEARGYLRQDRATKRYRLGFAALRVGRAAVVDTPTAVAQPHLRALAQEVGEQTMLWVLDGDHAVCVEKIPGRHALRTHTDLGAREPAMLMASGRCLLVDMDDAQLQRLPGADNGRIGRFPSIRADGFEVSVGDRWEDVNAVASPVRDHVGAIVAAIAVSGAATRFTEAELPVAAQAVVRTAARISRDLGAP